MSENCQKKSQKNGRVLYFVTCIEIVSLNWRKILTDIITLNGLLPFLMCHLPRKNLYLSKGLPNFLTVK